MTALAVAIKSFKREKSPLQWYSHQLNRCQTQKILNGGRGCLNRKVQIFELY